MGGLLNTSAKLFDIQAQTQNQIQQLQTQAYGDEAALQEAQGNYAMADAEQAAIQKANEARAFAGDQENAYLNSGVTASGSVLDALHSTYQQSRQEEQAILNRGVAEQDLYRRRAAQVRNSGRAQILGQNYDLTSSQLAYSMAERRSIGTGAYNLLGTAATAVTRPLFSSLWKKFLGP